MTFMSEKSVHKTVTTVFVFYSLQEYEDQFTKEKWKIHPHIKTAE